MTTLLQARRAGTLTQKQVLDLLYGQSMKSLRGLENGNTAALMRAYRSAQDELVARIASSFGDVEAWTLQEWEASGRLRDLLTQVDHTIDRLKATANYEIERGSRIQFISSYERAAWSADQATPQNIRVRYAPPPDAAVKILVNTPYKGAMFSRRIVQISDLMAAQIKDQLTQSLIQGEGMGAAAKRITNVVGIGRLKDPKSFTARALTIARSEIMRAQNMAMDHLYGQNKDLLQGDGETTWLVTPDDRLCPWCMRREGLTDAEIEAAAPGEDPWGRSTECPLHPNCRCVKLPKLKTWKELLGLDMPEHMASDVRGMRDADGKWTIQPVEKFDAWLAQRGGSSGG